MIPADAMREAVKAMVDVRGDLIYTAPECRTPERDAFLQLTAALPLIEASVREQVAGEIAEAIEAERRLTDFSWDREDYGYNCAISDGVVIARSHAHGPELARGATTTPSAGTDGGEV